MRRRTTSRCPFKDAACHYTLTEVRAFDQCLEEPGTVNRNGECNPQPECRIVKELRENFGNELNCFSVLTGDQLQEAWKQSVANLLAQDAWDELEHCEIETHLKRLGDVLENKYH